MRNTSFFGVITDQNRNKKNTLFYAKSSTINSQMQTLTLAQFPTEFMKKFLTFFSEFLFRQCNDSICDSDILLFSGPFWLKAKAKSRHCTLWTWIHSICSCFYNTCIVGKSVCRKASWHPWWPRPDPCKSKASAIPQLPQLPWLRHNSQKPTD